MSNEEVLDILLSNHNFIIEKIFNSHFPIQYQELQKIIFPDNFSFSQKLYHFFHNDINLKLGLCKKCGNRCSFRSFNDGYQLYCSIQCRNTDKDIIEHTKSVYKNKSDEEKKEIHKKQSESHLSKTQEEKQSIIEKIKTTKLLKYNDENYNNHQKCEETKLLKYGDKNYRNIEKYKDSIKNKDASLKELTRIKKQNT